MIRWQLITEVEDIDLKKQYVCVSTDYEEEPHVELLTGDKVLANGYFSEDEDVKSPWEEVYEIIENPKSN